MSVKARQAREGLALFKAEAVRRADEGTVNIIDNALDSTTEDVLQSDFPVMTGRLDFNPEGTTMTTENEEGFTETVNPAAPREPTKQEIAAEKAQAKIVAKAAKLAEKAAKLEAATLVLVAKAQAKIAAKAARANKTSASKEAREAAKAERAARLAALNADGERKYTGSMLALADRVKLGLYVKGVTGQLRSNDELAQILDGVTPNGVIQTAKTVLALDVNPYSHLNVGQQSMNLRNKLRGALRKGTISLHTIRTYVADNELDVSQSIVEKAAAKAARVATAKAEREARAAAQLAASEAVEA